jgi:hypothetical protein
MLTVALVIGGKGGRLRLFGFAKSSSATAFVDAFLMSECEYRKHKRPRVF